MAVLWYEWLKTGLSTAISPNVDRSEWNLALISDVSPWPWSLKPKSLFLALTLVHQVLGLGLAIQVRAWPWPWPWGWSLALNAWYDCIWHKLQVTKIPHCTVVVSAGSGKMYRHMVMALYTYHLGSVSNLQLILGNLLLLIRLDVGPWPRSPSSCPWPWFWVPSLNLALALGPKSLLTSLARICCCTDTLVGSFWTRSVHGRLQAKR